MRNFLKIFLVCSFVFSGLSAVFCCGPYFGFPDDTLSFFETSVAADPFFYSYIPKYSQPYGVTVTEDVKEKALFDEEAVLTSEWKDYFAKNYKDKVSVDVIRSMLFDETGKTANYVKKLLKLGFNSNEITNNAAVTAINSAGDRDTLEYLNFMYDINALFSSINNRYSWDEVDEAGKEKEHDLLNDLLGLAKSRLKNMKNDFLYLRYSYQIIKILAYFENFDEVISFYGDKVANIKSTSLVKLRCTGYRAMAYYRTEDLSNALNDYLYVFDQSAPLMESVRLSLDSMNISDKKWQDYIAKDDNKTRKINAYFLWASKDERFLPFDVMEKMENLNPASSKPEILLVRSIQSIEKYFPKGKDFSAYVRTCERISKLEKVRQPALWLIAGSYMSLLNGKLGEAERLFGLADAIKGKKDALNSQVALIGTLIAFRQNDFIMNVDVMNGFIEGAKWAKTLGGDYKNNNGIYHSILAYIGDKLLEQGNLPGSIMCYLLCGGEYGYIDREVYLTGYMDYSKAQYLLDVYATDVDLAFIESIFRNEARFDLFGNLREYSSMNLNDIVYLRGIKEFRKGNFTEATIFFKKLPADYKQVRFSRSNPELELKAKYETMDIASFSDMLGRLKSAISAKKDDAAKYYEIGNIYYSMEMLGFPDIARRKKRSWGMEGYAKIHSYDFNEFPLYPKSKKFKQEKYDEFIRITDNFLKAENNYSKIIDIGNNKELAAKSCILINTCRNNYLYVMDEENNFSNPIDYKNPDKNKMKYFLMLKNYKDTKFYGEFIKECPLVQEFE